MARLGPGEPVDTGHQHVVDAVGNLDRPQVAGQRHAPVLPAQGAVLQQRLGDLLHEERVALRLARDQTAHRLRHLGAPQRDARQLRGLRLGERIDRDALVIAAVSERVAVTRPVRADQQDARPGHRLREEV